MSAKLALWAVAVAVCVGIPIGCLAAYHRGKWADNAIIFCHLRHCGAKLCDEYDIDLFVRAEAGVAANHRPERAAELHYACDGPWRSTPPLT